METRAERVSSAEEIIRQDLFRSRGTMQCDCGMSTSLPQRVPLFGHMNVQVDFRSECLDSGLTAKAFQSYFISLKVRIDAAATAKAFNSARTKPALRVHSPMNLGPSTSLEILISLFCLRRSPFFGGREGTLVQGDVCQF